MIPAQPARLRQSENCTNLLGALDAPPCREASYLAVVDAANSRVFGGWTLQIQIGPPAPPTTSRRPSGMRVAVCTNHPERVLSPAPNSCGPKRMDTSTPAVIRSPDFGVASQPVSELASREAASEAKGESPACAGKALKRLVPIEIAGDSQPRRIARTSAL
jgi:hypothetical protein